MAKSTYYYLVNKEEVDVVAIRNEPVLKEIKIIFTENKGLYGVRRVHNELINRGFKVKCIEMYERGEYPETPNGITTRKFKDTIRKWKRMVDSLGIGVLRHKTKNKKWNPEEKLVLVSKILAGYSYNSVALDNGINYRTLYKWVQKYKEKGYNGLVDEKKGRPRKVPIMKENSSPKPLKESEREELIRLRAENKFIKTEIENIKAEKEIIKKLIALRREKWAAQLKAKKQQSSKNLEKKDIN